MIGRERELAALERHLDAVRAGPSLLAVTGEPGIGKSRLLGELAARAEARGWLVLGGRALEFETAVPYAPFVDALDADLDPRALARLPEDVLTELARVFPPLAERPPVSLPAERFRLHRATRALLNEIARGRALMLILDDMQWADEASLELLATLARRPPAARLLIAVAYRPAQAPAALAAELPDAIELAPLSEEQTLVLLADVDPTRARAIHVEAGGNPFYAEQLARSGGRGTAEAAIERELAGMPTSAPTSWTPVTTTSRPRDPARSTTSVAPSSSSTATTTRSATSPAGSRSPAPSASGSS